VRVLLGRDRGDVLELVAAGHQAHRAAELGHDPVGGLLDATPQQHRVGPPVNGEHAFANDRLG
jgi:hypothetical protein